MFEFESDFEDSNRSEKFRVHYINTMGRSVFQFIIQSMGFNIMFPLLNYSLFINTVERD